MHRLMPPVLVAAMAASWAHVFADLEPEPPSAPTFMTADDDANLTRQIAGNEIDTVNELTLIAIDARALYGEVAETTHDATHRSILETLAVDRGEMAGALQQRTIALGGAPAERGDAVGTFHLASTSLRTPADSDSLAAVDEAFRRESYLVDAFDKALNEDLSAPTRSLLQAKLIALRASCDRIEALRTRIAQQTANLDGT